MSNMPALAVSAQFGQGTAPDHVALHAPFIPWTDLKLPLKQCEKGNCIFNQGEKVVSLYILRKGAVLITRLSADCRETILGILGPGDYFGDLPLLNGGVASFNTLGNPPH